MTKEDLKKLIDVYDYAYYNKSHSLVTDEEYDAVKSKWLALGGEDFVSGSAVSGDRVKHVHSLLSLEKETTRAGLVKHLKRLWPVVVEPKIDGLSIEIWQGKAITRGDGEYGDVCPHASKIKVLERALPMNPPEPVRIEVFMLKYVFERLKEAKPELANARNAASGIMTSKNGDGIEFLSYRAIGIPGSKLSVSEQQAKMMKWGFYTAGSVIDVDAEGDAENLADAIMEFNRNTLPYAIDGLVIKHDKPNAEEKFGSTGHHPKSAIAWKFLPPGAWTKMTGVTWQVGRTGKFSA